MNRYWQHHPPPDVVPFPGSRYEYCGCQRGDVLYVPVPGVKNGIRAEKILLDIQFKRGPIVAKVRLLTPASGTSKVVIPVNHYCQPSMDLLVQWENGDFLSPSFSYDLETNVGPDSTTKGAGHYFDIPESATPQWTVISYSVAPLEIGCTGTTVYRAALQGLSKWREVPDLQLVFRSDLGPLSEHKLPDGGVTDGNEFRLVSRNTTVELDPIVYVVERRRRPKTGDGNEDDGH